MLTEVCGYLKNWFNRKIDGTDYPKYKGEITISSGKITTGDLPLLDGQYFRVLGSVLNDGVYQYSEELALKDEVFDGEIWSMAVPADVIALSDEIDAWREKYEKADSEAMSPFMSESFGGYSYSKSSGGSGEHSSSAPSWISTFSARLSRYKKL